MRGSVYCTASFSVFSRRRAKLSIIYPDIRLDYKLATLPPQSPVCSNGANLNRKSSYSQWLVLAFFTVVP